jgi:hypothetical protein
MRPWLAFLAGLATFVVLASLGLMALVNQPRAAPTATARLVVRELVTTDKPVALVPTDVLTVSAARLATAGAQGGGRTIVASGPSTAGTRLTIAGRPVQLDPDTYVESYVLSVTCEIGRPCPRTPMYALRRGESRISLSQPTGEIVFERIAPGEDGAFEAIKDQLR